MRCLVIVLLLIVFQLHYGLLAKLETKENRTEVDQQRSARVHRVSVDDFTVNKDSNPRNAMNEASSKGIFSLETQNILQSFSERLQSAIPHLNELVQREAQLFKELNVILKELPRDETMRSKRVDLTTNEMIDTTASATSLKSQMKDADHLNSNLLNSPEELDIYHQDSQDDEKQQKLGSTFSRMESTSDFELRTVKNIAQYLDDILLEIQNHITYVRSVFENLCRKHHSSRSNASNTGKFTTMNQPKKVSIL